MPAEYKYFASSKGKRFHGVSHDVSPYGMCILSDDLLVQGDQVDLKVVMPSVNMTIELKGEVRHCTYNRESLEKSLGHFIGIRFTEGTLENLSVAGTRNVTSRVTPSQTIIINAGAKSCVQSLSDFVRYPEWASGIEKARVLESYPDGRGKRVEFIHDFFFRKVRYILDYFYDDKNNVLSWVSAGGDDEIMKITGSYSFIQKGPSTTFATYSLDITLSIVPSKRLVQYVTTFLMRKEMKNFKNFVEKNASRIIN